MAYGDSCVYYFQPFIPHLSLFKVEETLEIKQILSEIGHDGSEQISKFSTGKIAPKTT